MCWILCMISCILLCQCSRLSATIQLDDPDINRNVTQLISSKGYPVRDHIVQTVDGYLLSMQRIPKKRNSNRDGAVLLLHGIVGDATTWVLNFPNQSLAFILHDAGYDVWLLNTRGCTYSKKHVKYTANQDQFWNFSFQDVGKYDIPATIDYILDATGNEDLSIIGYSQGTSATFAMLCDRKEYNDKVKIFIALAPVAKFAHTSLIFRLATPFAFAVDTLTAGEIYPHNKDTSTILEIFCGVIATEACLGVLYAAEGLNRHQCNETRLAVYIAHIPAGTSAKSMLHYSQLLTSGKFRKYDYGHILNLKYYHQVDPPDYDVSLISTPVALMWSTNDKIAHPKDVEYLRRNINTLVLDYQVPYHYTHFDFTLALNAREMIYEPILQLLSQTK